MCTPNTELKFCTCIEGDIAEIKNIYIWTLYRYYGSRESLRRGKVMMPVDDFQNGISVENISLKLNEGNIFDFDYAPEERDSLHISFNAENSQEYKYFSLIFKNGIWQEGNNPFFTSIQKEIATGEIKVIYKEENHFLKHCEYLESEYGIVIPESIKVKYAHIKSDSEDPIYLAIRNLKRYKLFYTPEFIKSVAKTYFKIYPDENSERLQEMINSAQNKFSLLESKFISGTENFNFLNRCLKDLNYEINKCFSVAIPIDDENYLIINGILSGTMITKVIREKKYIKNKTQKLRFENFEIIKNLNEY